MLIDLFKSFVSIALELTVLFIGVSFLINLIQGVIPYEKLNHYLSAKNRFFGALVALLLAFITPFCSCSTIPIVVNMLNKKMPFGIVMIFLFASPILDPTILTLMAALLGIKVAIYYSVITSAFSVMIGLGLEKIGFQSAVKKVVMSGFEDKPVTFSFSNALKETGQLIKTVYPFLLLGAAIGAIIHGVVPTSWIAAYFGGNQWWLIPAAAIIGIPLYIRLSTMIPISQMMLVKGMALGPIMALVISSAGASLPEVTLLNSIFHKRLVVTFVLSVFSMATLSGTLFYFV